MKEIAAVISQQEAKLSCNFEQVEQAIRDMLAEYKGAVFTESSKKDAKKYVAGLRKQKKDLQDNLREEKKKYMKPWEELEEKAKRLIGMFDEPICLITGQIQIFEEKRIADKKQLIKQIFQELAPGLNGR